MCDANAMYCTRFGNVLPCIYNYRTGNLSRLACNQEVHGSNLGGLFLSYYVISGEFLERALKNVSDTFFSKQAKFAKICCHTCYDSE